MTEGNKKIKALYVGFALFGDEDATGSTLLHIFQGCEQIEWLQACQDYDPAYHRSAYDAVYVSPARSPLYYLVKRVYRKGGVKEESADGAINTNRLGGNPLVGVIRGMLDILPKRYDKITLSKIDEFAPEVIYTLGENIATLRTALFFAKRYNAPIIMHIMDNNEDSMYAGSALTAPFRRMYLRLNEKAFARSTGSLAISPKMAEEFVRRHNIPFSFAMNCLQELHPGAPVQHEKLRLVFSGGLHGGRAQTLTELGRIIREDERLSQKMNLEVFSSPKHIAQFGTELAGTCTLAPYVPKEEMYENLGSADLLVHVESFRENEIEFFRYSMSTKIPECLSVGRPIFCIGPKEICSVEYLARSGACIHTDDLAKVRETLLNIAEGAYDLEALGAQALVCAGEHLSENVSKRVTELFLKVKEGAR